MKWFSNMATAGKIMTGIGAMALLLWVVLALSFYSIRDMEKKMQRINDLNLANVADVENLKSTVNLVRGKMFKVLLVPENREVLETEKSEIDSAKVYMFEMMANLRDRNAANPELVRQLEDVESALLQYLRTQSEETWPALTTGDYTGALQQVLEVQTPRIERIREATTRFAKEEELAAAAAVADAQATANTAMLLYLTAGVISLLLALGVVVVLNRSIADPLRKITGLAERVAAYDLTMDIEDRGRRDEVGSLITTTSSMINSLRALARTLNEGVNVLVSSTTEILASTSQTAASITQTATAITETTTTVEEVKQTAQLTSQKAKAVSESATKANDFAKSGSKAVEDMGEVMRAIREHFRGIVENIMQLSTQSQGIGAIIATVDDISEQSNVLAVNAAIEAAKAGEHGRSFSVVAQEVRNLAEQSKEATRQVRQLLSEIQRGVSTAGMATEQGSKAVENGIKQADDTVKLITQLLLAIAESAQAAMQIAASSQQQLVGMDQVAMAMENIRGASEQNVGATRQVEDSARMLNGLGQRLKAIVEQYKVPGAAA